ncbi:uncharacterized protein LOC141729436 [Zonotrichia albicollis]|uniref:uncharacterized protein LOC141729436 n=1 Tax=Zonotrichia albicollis TaxID=44394 RepID=UPI003D80BE2F
MEAGPRGRCGAPEAVPGEGSRSLAPGPGCGELWGRDTRGTPQLGPGPRILLLVLACPTVTRGHRGSVQTGRYLLLLPCSAPRSPVGTVVLCRPSGTSSCCPAPRSQCWAPWFCADRAEPPLALPCPTVTRGHRGSLQTGQNLLLVLLCPTVTRGHRGSVQTGQNLLLLCSAPRSQCWAPWFCADPAEPPPPAALPHGHPWAPWFCADRGFP